MHNQPLFLTYPQYKKINKNSLIYNFKKKTFFEKYFSLFRTPHTHTMDSWKCPYARPNLAQIKLNQNFDIVLLLSFSQLLHSHHLFTNFASFIIFTISTTPFTLPLNPPRKKDWIFFPLFQEDPKKKIKKFHHFLKSQSLSQNFQLSDSTP